MKNVMVCVSVLMCWVVAGCATPGGSGEVSSQSSFANEFKDAPKWVRTKTCDANVAANAEKRICGMGQHVVESSRRINNATVTAQARGCAAIAAVLSQSVGRVIKASEDEVSREGIDKNSESDFEASAENAVKQVAEMKDMPGCKPVDTWISPSNNMYALMQLDVNLALDAVEKLVENQSNVKMLDPRVRKAIKDNRAKMLKELSF
jgi:hypothetical protein